jgi:Tol biopolymer transport system component/DNA-binding winged helix-turn-helix (wHTH) protein
MAVAEKPTIRFGPFELDPRCGQLRKNGTGLKLQGQPLQVLEILLEKPRQLVTREEIRQRLWTADTFVDFDHSLNTAVKKLRQALGDEADTPRYIETLPKRGYRFIGEVDREGATEEAPGPRLVVAPLAAPAESLQLVDGKRPRRWRWVAGVAGAVLAAAAAVVYSVFIPPPQPRIVGSHVLTKTGNPKSWLRKPFTDRGSVYFFEQGPSGRVTLQVPVVGGEVSEIPIVNGGVLRDISRDGSQLLSITYDPKRNQSDAWTQSLPAGVPRLIVKDADWPLWTADGRGIFFIRNNYTELYRANADGTDVQRLATLPGFGFPHLSPDGARIRFTGPLPALAMWEVRADGGNPHPILGGRNYEYGGSWSLDGEYYFFTSWDGDRWSLWAVSEARHWWKKSNTSLPEQLTFGPMSIGTPAISNDGKQLYATAIEQHGELSVYDAKSGKFVPYLSGIPVCYVDFSRDGQWIAYVSYPEGTLWRSRIDGSERRQLTVPPLGVMNPRWSPDGKLIAFMDRSNGDRRQMSESSPNRIYVVSAEGGGPVLLLAGNFGDPTWSSDGGSIAYNTGGSAGPDVRILDLKTQKSTTVQGSEGMWSPRWSPDGQYLVALAYPTTKLMLFSFATNTWEELASGSNFAWNCWSHDSKFVYAQDNDSLVRIAISDHKKEQIASLKGFRSTAYWMDRWNAGWFGVAPDGRPITTRDTGIQEIYAFDLEYK